MREIENQWADKRTTILCLVTLISFNLLFAMTSYTPVLNKVKVTFGIDDFWVSLSVESGRPWFTSRCHFSADVRFSFLSFGVH